MSISMTATMFCTLHFTVQLFTISVCLRYSSVFITGGTFTESILYAICAQGFLYKKSGKPLSKEWKKKYVTLMDDGHLIYYPNYNVSVVLSICFVDSTLHIISWNARIREPA